MDASGGLRAVAALVFPAVLAGCACFDGLLPAAPAARAPSSRQVAQADSALDAQRRWCAARYDDYLAGRRPGGAETLEEKREHDRICAPLLGHVKAGL